MTSLELTETLKELKKWKNLRDEADGIISALEDKIKGEMAQMEQDDLRIDEFHVQWKTFTRNGIDTARLKADLPDIAKQYTKVTTGRRFTVS